MGSVQQAGAVQVIYGVFGTGLTAAGNQLWSQDSANPDPVPGGAEFQDWLGLSLAAGDFDGNGRADLAIGVPYEDVGTLDAGAVNVLYASTPQRVP